MTFNFAHRTVFLKEVSKFGKEWWPWTSRTVRNAELPKFQMAKPPTSYSSSAHPLHPEIKPSAVHGPAPAPAPRPAPPPCVSATTAGLGWARPGRGARRGQTAGPKVNTASISEQSSGEARRGEGRGGREIT